jgi:hypothetical protein
MKLTKSKLKRIIQEELQKVLMREASSPLAGAARAADDAGEDISLHFTAAHGGALPRGMEISADCTYCFIEDATTKKNPQIKAVQRIRDQISSCAPHGVPYGGEQMEVGAKRLGQGKWGHGRSDPRSEAYSAWYDEEWMYLLGAVKLEDYEFAIQEAMKIQEGLPTECQQLGANLLQLLGSFVAKGGGVSGVPGTRFKPKESEVPTDPRHSR